MAGREIAQIPFDKSNIVRWDGRSMNGGTEVANGCYLINLDSKNGITHKRLLLSR